MALDAIQKAKLQEKKLQRMYKKRAKVSIKDLEIFKLNVAFLVIAVVFMTVGGVLIGIFLGTYDGQNYSSSNSNDTKYPYYIGAQFCAVGAGIGVFFFIMSVVGFIDDYIRTKKRLIEKVIKEDQEKAAAEAAKNANMNIFQMLAQNIRNSKLAN